MNAALGLATVVFALLGVVVVVRALGRALARLGRGLDSRARALCAGAVNAWRSRSAARERRTIKRRESLGALQAETIRELTSLLAEHRAELTALRGTRVPTPTDAGSRASWERAS